MRSVLRHAAFLIASALLVACAPARYFAEPKLSLFVLGDMGRTPKDGSAPPRQVAVGAAMAREHAQDPVDYVLFSGDNFYPDGLLAAELELRVRANLIEPYCAFVRVAPGLARELLGRCAAPGSAGAVELLAVLGNHDHHKPESAELERSSLPLFIENWRLLGLPVELVQLAPGVDLIAYDSTWLRSDEGAAQLGLLTEALRASRGPWRILLTHHPLDDQERSHVIEDAIAAAGVPVQLLLAGHIHDLRVSTPEPPLPALQVVSGGGGGSEGRERPLPEQRFALRSTGFTRVDLYAASAEPRIAVTQFAVATPEPAKSAAPDAPTAPETPAEAAAEPVSRFVVTLGGAVREETPAR